MMSTARDEQRPTMKTIGRGTRRRSAAAESRGRRQSKRRGVVQQTVGPVKTARVHYSRRAGAAGEAQAQS
jgi:hypothetical protein